MQPGPSTSVRELKKVLGLLDGGNMEATYKPALLLALVDLSAEAVGAGQPADELRLPLLDVASRVAELYWQQVRPEPLRDLLPHETFYRLRQGTSDAREPAVGKRPGAERRIPKTVHALREHAQSRGLRSALQVQTTLADDWRAMTRDVAHALARQPVPRLQRPGTARGQEFDRFLYDDSAFSESMSKRAAIASEIVLRPGVALMLSDAAALLRPAIESKWTSLVASFNGLSIIESSLRDYLFGSERSGLDRVREGLLGAGVRSCFWCRRPLRTEVEVDHVVPWSAFANDGLFNLVLTDRSCNGDKSNILVDPHLLRRWVAPDRNAFVASIAAELSWPVARARSLRVARAAYAGLAEQVPTWSGLKSRALFDGERRELVASLLVD